MRWKKVEDDKWVSSGPGRYIIWSHVCINYDGPTPVEYLGWSALRKKGVKTKRLAYALPTREDAEAECQRDLDGVPRKPRPKMYFLGAAQTTHTTKSAIRKARRKSQVADRTNPRLKWFQTSKGVWTADDGRFEVNSMPHPFEAKEYAKGKKKVLNVRYFEIREMAMGWCQSLYEKTAKTPLNRA